MSELTTEMCAFPGCERPAVPAPEGAGRPSRYCDVPEHNAQSAFRERRRRAAAGELDGSDGAEQGRGERPVSLAGATLRAVAARLIADLERTRDALGVLTDTEQLEAELAAVRADTQAEVAHAAQHEAAARREAQEAVARAEQAEKERAAALARAQDAEQERSQALEQVRQAQLERQAVEHDAQLARKEAEHAEQLAAAAERRAEQADERAQGAVERFDRLAREAGAGRVLLRAGGEGDQRGRGFVR